MSILCKISQSYRHIKKKIYLYTHLNSVHFQISIKDIPKEKS
jgi:hypothetical protein